MLNNFYELRFLHLLLLAAFRVQQQIKLLQNVDHVPLKLETGVSEVVVTLNRKFEWVAVSSEFPLKVKRDFLFPVHF